METLTITGKTWKAGLNTLVLTITKPIIETLNIQKGDIIQATITKIERTKKQEEKEENNKPKISIRK